MTEQKQSNLADFMKGITSAGKRTGADILEGMANSAHMKSDISNPLAYVGMHVFASWAGHTEGGNEPLVERVDREIANLGEQFSVARKGKRASDIIDAVKSVLTQEFEIEKQRARRLFG